MADWVDHYRVLQVHQEADRDVIEAAYKKLAAKYHPDVNKDRGATGKMQQLNAARDVLTDPSKRADYDVLWHSHQASGSAPGSSSGPTYSRGGSSPVPPRPVAEPAVLTVEAADGKPGRATFTLRNVGGPYGRIGIHVASGDSCLQVLGCESLTASDELPLRVTVEAHSNGSRRTRISRLQASLDGESVEVNVVVVAQYEPAGSAGVKRDRGGSADMSGWIRDLLRVGMAATGTLLLIPGLLFDLLLLLAAVTSLGQAGPARSALCISVTACAVMSLLIVAPGAGLLRRSLMEGYAAQKWWQLSLSEIKEDGRWLLPLGLGVVGGMLAWKRVKVEDRARALKMLTWGIAVSVLQPVAMALFMVTKPA